MQYNIPINSRKRTKSKQNSKNSRRTSDYSSLSSSSEEGSQEDRWSSRRTSNKRNHAKKQNKIDTIVFPEANQLSKQSSMKATTSKISPLKGNESINQFGDVITQGINNNTNNLQSSISQIQNQLKAIRSRVDNIGTICTQEIAQGNSSSSGRDSNQNSNNSVKVEQIRSTSRGKTQQIQQDNLQSQQRQSKSRDKSNNSKNKNSRTRQSSKNTKRKHTSYKQHSSYSSLTSSCSSSSRSQSSSLSRSSSKSSSSSPTQSRGCSKDKPTRCHCSRKCKNNHNKFILLKSQILLHLNKLNYESRNNILLKSILTSKSSLMKSSKLTAKNISSFLKDTLEAFVDYAQRSNYYQTRDHSNTYFNNMTNIPNNPVINIQQFSQQSFQPRLQQKPNWIIEQAILKQQQQVQQEELQQPQQIPQTLRSSSIINPDNNSKVSQSESKITAEFKKHRSQTNAEQLDQQSTPQNKTTSNSKNSNNNKASDSTASTATQAALRSNQEFILVPQQLSNTSHSINTLSKTISSNSLNQTPWSNNNINNNRQKGSFSAYESSSGILDDEKFRKIYLPQKLQKERIMEFGGILTQLSQNTLQSDNKSSTYERFYYQQMYQKQQQMQLQALNFQQQQKSFWEQQQNQQYVQQQANLNINQPISSNMSQQTHQKVPSMLAPFDSFMCHNPSQDKGSSFVRSSNPSFDYLSPQFKDYPQSNEQALMNKGLAYPMQQMDSFNSLSPYSIFPGRYKQLQGVYQGNPENITYNQHSNNHNHHQNSNNSSNGLPQNHNHNNASLPSDNLNQITMQQQQQPEHNKLSREEDEDDIQGQLSCRSEIDKEKSVTSSSICRESSSSWKPMRSKQSKGLPGKQQSEYFQSPENTPTSIRSHNSKTLQQIGLMPCHRINKSIGQQNNPTSNNNTINSNSQANNTQHAGPVLKRKYSENSIQSVSTQYFANSTTVSHTLSPKSQKHQKQQQKMCKQCQILNNRQEIKKDMQKLPPCIDQVERKARNVQVAKNTMKDIINMDSKNSSNAKDAGNN